MVAIDKLFSFPIIMVDGEDEEKRQKADDYVKPPMDLIFGEAQFPYDDFIAITDRWLPRDESKDRARDKDFDACYVVFASIGSFTVPMKKERFLKKLKAFSEAYEAQNPRPKLPLIKLQDLFGKEEKDASSDDTEGVK